LRIVYSQQAIEDLETYVTYVAGSNPDVAARLARRVLLTVDRLASRAFEGPEQQLRSTHRVSTIAATPTRSPSCAFTIKRGGRS